MSQVQHYHNDHWSATLEIQLKQFIDSHYNPDGSVAKFLRFKNKNNAAPFLARKSKEASIRKFIKLVEDGVIPKPVNYDNVIQAARSDMVCTTEEQECPTKMHHKRKLADILTEDKSLSKIIESKILNYAMIQGLEMVEDILGGDLGERKEGVILLKEVYKSVFQQHHEHWTEALRSKYTTVVVNTVNQYVDTTNYCINLYSDDQNYWYVKITEK